ncbi:MAG TPA: helix-turn-helix domain-containing protein [Solirubrobacteraceae bacterium]|jgi:excisionase family DNA binding protein|nr:helix-turn-helix domain-containing protein [Solirubrobacteraceae bacterium]
MGLTRSSTAGLLGGGNPSNDGALTLELTLSAEQLDVIAARAVERLQPAPAGSPWMSVEQAAAYLGCPRSRIYRLVHLRRIPHHHEGARLLFERGELDAWVRTGGAS